MAPVQCKRCSWAIYSSKAVFTRFHGGLYGPGHTGAFVCLQCMDTFKKLKQRKIHMSSTRHKDPEDFQAMMAAAAAAADISPSTMPSINVVSRKCLHSHKDIPSGQTHAHCGLAEELASTARCSPLDTEDDHATNISQNISTDPHCEFCTIQLTPLQTLEEHYWESSSHLKCRPCVLGFGNLKAWAEHRADCPVSPFQRTSSKEAVGKQPAASLQQCRLSLGPSQPESTSVSSVPVSSVTVTTRETCSAPEPPLVDMPAVLPPIYSVPPVESTVHSRHYCAKCTLHFPSEQALQKHYSDSLLHPTCRACGLGFESILPWAAHKARCPPPNTGIRGSEEEPSSGTKDDMLSNIHASNTEVASEVPMLNNPTASPPILSDISRMTETTLLPRAASPIRSPIGNNARFIRPNSTHNIQDGDNQNTPVTPRPAGRCSGIDVESKTEEPSYHCRSCLSCPCTDPVVTTCGHLFCHRCIVRALTTKMRCPVCQTMFLVRL